MIQESSYDQVVALIRLKENVAVFLYVEGDPICHRSRSVLSAFSSKLGSIGYSVLALCVDEYSSHYEEVSCVRIPQLRLFRRGRMWSKTTFMLTHEGLDTAVKSAMP